MDDLLPPGVGGPGLGEGADGTDPVTGGIAGLAGGFSGLHGLSDSTAGDKKAGSDLMRGSAGDQFESAIGGSSM